MYATDQFCLLLAGSASILVQSAGITGRVTANEDGSGIPGATVLLKRTINGTIMAGNYSLRVDNPNSVLIFSCLDYLSQEGLLFANI